MSKPTILLVYQDCYDCEKTHTWHERVIDVAADAGILIKYVPYNLSGAKELILKAHEQGIEVPFLTDTDKFSRNLEDFIQPSAKELSPTKKKQKKR